MDNTLVEWAPRVVLGLLVLATTGYAADVHRRVVQLELFKDDAIRLMAQIECHLKKIEKNTNNGDK